MAAAAIAPTLALRVEVRPEVFTSLFAWVFLWLLLKYRERKAPFLWLAIALPVLEIFWVNLQIFFPLGEEVVLSATAQAIANSFAAVKGCRSMEGWGYRFLASDHHLPDLPARETVGRMPDAARKDLLEWYARNDLLNIVSDVLLRDVTL